MSNEVPAWRKENVEIQFDLTPAEVGWRSRQKMLERHGYLLRPRFRPDWVPSWLNTSKKPWQCEDAIFNPTPLVIDAKRMSDGTQVILKDVIQSSGETEIATFLSSEEHARNPMNHCVPILDIVRDESQPKMELLVMPLLRPFDDPPFFNVGEVLDFMKQTLEGLTFMHQLGVAHRDCSDMNIMFDAAGMYPKGFHASFWNMDASGKLAHPLRRSDVPAVKYYFTDFGLSKRFQEGEPRLVTGVDGLDQEVPELSHFKPYDPFPVDVFILGNLFRRDLVLKYSNLQFLNPLVENMTRHEPADRPHIKDALDQFEALASAVPGYVRRWRLKETEQGRLAGLIRDVGSARRECMYILKAIFQSYRRRA